jgi:hypothetical protein
VVASAAVLGLMSLALLTQPGCDALGYAANAVAGVSDVPAAYKDLHDQTCGVMVWVDRGIRIDEPNLEIDCAQSIQGKIEIAAKADAKEVQKITWIDADRLARYQEDHPELEGDLVTDFAGRLPMTRLIYIEIEDFQLKPADDVDLYRGEVKATIKVVQIANGVAKVAFEEDGVLATFPPHVTAEGAPLPDGEVDKFYAGTIDAFTTEVVKRFITHDSES